ncbi:MAG: hypothetical protein ACP5OG_06000 [Candidatus Nanoarchaeia archaeon]
MLTPIVSIIIISIVTLIVYFSTKKRAKVNEYIIIFNESISLLFYDDPNDPNKHKIMRPKDTEIFIIADCPKALTGMKKHRWLVLKNDPSYGNFEHYFRSWANKKIIQIKAVKSKVE